MRAAIRIALPLVAPGVPLLLALGLLPRHRLGLVDAYLLLVAALALASLLRALRRAGHGRAAGRGTGAAGQPPRPLATARPGDLEWLERRLRLAPASAFALQAVRSVVREVAAHRLEAHHQVDLDADPDAAQRLLGPDVWALLQPEAASEPAGWGRGGQRQPRWDSARLRRVIEALERT
jgi:hypothetical protein